MGAENHYTACSWNTYDNRTEDGMLGVMGLGMRQVVKDIDNPVQQTQVPN